MLVEWEPGFEIAVEVADSELLLRANRAGLVSLARHLLALADEDVGSHLHLTAGQEVESEFDVVLERFEP